MNHPSINRILQQIGDHKEELTSPESSMENEYVPEEKGGDPQPAKDVSEVITQEVLEEREKELEIAEKERERVSEEGKKRMEEMENHLESGGTPADIAPEETVETKGESLPDEVQKYLSSEKEEFEFHSCFDLRDFIEREKDNFEEWAHPALNSVIQAVNSITSGCKCKIKERRAMVENYYVTFITQNQHNALIGKMKEILKTKKIKFFSEEKLFLEI